MNNRLQSSNDLALCGAKPGESENATTKVWALLVSILLLLPLAGLSASGRLPAAFFEFPPRTRYVEDHPFSMPVFLIYLGGISAFCFWWVPQLKQMFGRRLQPRSKSARFPLYGWAGLVLLGAGWLLAWTRFEALSFLQLHTFLPLWLGYILTVAGLCHLSSGRSAVTDYRIRFWLLFPQSSAFWWIFEYLNRFVQNWSYQNVAQFDAPLYFSLATLSFSTVLPAVLVTKELLEGLFKFSPGRPLFSRALSLYLIALAFPALFLVGIYPQILFPIVWVAPLLLFAGVLVRGYPEFSSAFSLPIVSQWALAALICGFFWEMWNFFSLARWVYHVPYVARFYLFEMPVLGFAGYLPFGVFCGVICWMLGIKSRREGFV